MLSVLLPTQARLRINFISQHFTIKKFLNDSKEGGGEDDDVATPATVAVLPCEMRNQCGKDLMKNEKRLRDGGESQRAAACRTENWGKREERGGKKQWPVASPTAPSAERRFLCNTMLYQYE